jgi:16S rRNA (cytosine967-C5)-methyltransferase
MSSISFRDTRAKRSTSSAEETTAPPPGFAADPIRADELPGWEFALRVGCLRTLPCHLAEQGGMDGFFAARFRRA